MIYKVRKSEKLRNVKTTTTHILAKVVHVLDIAIQWINHHPADKTVLANK